MTELKLTPLPKDWRFEVRVRTKPSGVPVYKVTLQHKGWPIPFWDGVMSRDSKDLTDESLLAASKYLWEDYNEWREAVKREGFYGND